MAYSDLIIGADGVDPNGSASGASYVIFGGGNIGDNGTSATSNCLNYWD